MNETLKISMKENLKKLLKDLNWNKILKTDDKDPNKSMDNFYQQINYLLDEFAPYKKITKKQFRLKSKPWINNEILTKIKQRDKLFHKYCKEKDSNKKVELYNEYKIVRNVITTNITDQNRFYSKLLTLSRHF